jgi:hypothetical protein
MDSQVCVGEKGKAEAVKVEGFGGVTVYMQGLSGMRSRKRGAKAPKGKRINRAFGWR